MLPIRVVPRHSTPHSFMANFARSTVSVSSRYKQIDTMAFVSRPKVGGPIPCVLFACNAFSLPQLRNGKNTTESSIPHYSPLCQLFSPTSHIRFHPTSTGFVETVPHPHLPFHRGFVSHTRSLPVYPAAHIVLTRLGTMVYGSTENSSMA